jgi:hypothetical protein
MNHPTACVSALAGMLSFLPFSSANAAVVAWLQPVTQTVNWGDTFAVEIRANLSLPVVGWGLDVDFNNSGLLSIAAAPTIGPNWFGANSPDGDGLAGLAFPSAISGNDVLLAILHLRAIDIGQTDILLSVTEGDLTEGFALQQFGQFDTVQFLSGEVIVVPAGSGVITVVFGVFALRRRRRRGTTGPTPQRANCRPVSVVLLACFIGLVCHFEGTARAETLGPYWTQSSWQILFSWNVPANVASTQAFGFNSTGDGTISGAGYNYALAKCEVAADPGPFGSASGWVQVDFTRKFTLPGGTTYTASLWGKLSGALYVQDQPYGVSAVSAFARIVKLLPDGSEQVVLRLDSNDNPGFHQIIPLGGPTTWVPPQHWTELDVTPPTLAPGNYEVRGTLRTDAGTTNGSLGLDASSRFFDRIGAPSGWRVWPGVEAVRDVIYISDFRDRNGPFREGLMRQYLGLLNANGRPTLNMGNLPPLVSADGTKKGFDMDGGSFTLFREAVAALKPNGGTLIINTHGTATNEEPPKAAGGIIINGSEVRGFFPGTGGCGDDPYRLDNIGVKTNVTVHMIVCFAAAQCQFPDCVRSVAETLRRSIVDPGGSVTNINALNVPVNIGIRMSDNGARVLNNNQKLRLQQALIHYKHLVLPGLPFRQHYARLQETIDDFMTNQPYTLQDPYPNVPTNPQLMAGDVVARIRYGSSNLPGWNYPAFALDDEEPPQVPPETVDNGDCPDCSYNPPTLCDLNYDGVVDATDALIFMSSFGYGVGDDYYVSAADSDGDGQITLVDYQAWLQCYAEHNAPPNFFGGWNSRGGTSANEAPRNAKR